MELESPLKIPDELKGLHLALAIVKFFLHLAILVSNGGVVLLLVIHKLLCKQRAPLPPAGYFVVNLLVADTIVGVVRLTRLQLKLWPENTIQLAKSHYQCSFLFAVVFFSICGSHNALLSVIIDRYIAIAHTLRYRDMMTRTRCLRMLAASWLIPVIGWTYLMFFGEWNPKLPACNEHFMLYNFAYFWIPLFAGTMITIVVIQICVYLKIREYDSNPLISSVVVRQSSKKSARLMLQSAIVFCVCYAPVAVGVTLFVFCPKPSTKLFFELAGVGTAATYLINPCLYSLKTESIRKRLSDVFTELRTIFSRRNVRNDQINNQDVAAKRTVSVIRLH